MYFRCTPLDLSLVVFIIASSEAPFIAALATKPARREPILLDRDGLILDGRNRERACRELGIRPRTRVWHPRTGESVLALVISLNIRRRHLDATQKALLAYRLLSQCFSRPKRKRANGRQGKEHGRGQKVSQKVEQPIGKNERAAAAKGPRQKEKAYWRGSFRSVTGPCVGVVVAHRQAHTKAARGQADLRDVAGVLDARGDRGEGRSESTAGKGRFYRNRQSCQNRQNPPQRT